MPGRLTACATFFTWLGDLLLPEWLDDFSLGDYFAGAFDFEWIDMLPSWEWGDIIPDMPSFSMPDFGGLFGGDGSDDVDVPDVPTKTPDLPTIKEVRADTGKVEVLQAKITAVMSDAQEIAGCC